MLKKELTEQCAVVDDKSIPRVPPNQPNSFHPFFDKQDRRQAHGQKVY